MIEPTGPNPFAEDIEAAVASARRYIPWNRCKRGSDDRQIGTPIDAGGPTYPWGPSFRREGGPLNY
jgi:hypothetical protein